MGERAVVLVTLDWARAGDGRRGLGAASIVAELRAQDAEVVWVEGAVNDPAFDLEGLVAEVLEAVARLGKRTLVGIGCYVWNDPQVDVLLDALRQTDADIVLGGPQISFCAKDDLAHRYPGVRYFVRGYGERAMADLARGTEKHGEHGLFDAFQDDHGARFDGDLTTLRSPYLSGLLPSGGDVRWETQRGCPYRCAFCQHREPDRRHRPRLLGEDRLHAELAGFVDAGATRISVLDPVFHVKPARAASLLSTARDLGLSATLSLQCRFELIDERFLDALDGLDVTLEFGLQTIHEKEGEAVQRRNDMARVERALQAVKRRGIDFEVSLIYGLPEQTLQSFEASVAWCIERGVPRVRAWPLMLLRGTPLFHHLERWQLVESEGPIPEVVASSTFTVEENRAMREIAAALLAPTAMVAK